MWSHEHDRRTKSLVNSLAADVARAVSVDRLGADIFPAFASAARRSLTKALAEFASSINEQSPINCLPPELLGRIARFLPFRTVVSCNAVCRKWRSALQDDTRLWTRLEVHLTDTPARWATTLGPLLARSCRFPLRLSVRFNCGVHFQALHECLKLVVSHLDHIVELSVGVPLALAQDCLWVLVAAPAPMLEIFRFLCQDERHTSEFIKYMPPNLFAGLRSPCHTPTPPCARFLEAEANYIRSFPCPNVALDVADDTPKLPALDTLVLLSGCIPDATPTVLPPMQSVATLFVSDTITVGTDALLPLFPAAARSTMLSFGQHNVALEQQNVAPERIPSHLQAAAPIRDLDFFVRPFGLARTSPCRQVYYAMRINGALTYVDLNGLRIQDLFSQKHAHTFSVHTVERLALPLALAGVLPLFRARLTGLRELVLYADPDLAATWPAALPNAAIPLETLRFAVRADQVWSAAARALWTFQVGPIVKMLATAIGRQIRMVVLPGFTALTKADLANMVDEIVLDSPAPAPTDPGFGSWFWDFDADAALHA